MKIRPFSWGWIGKEDSKQQGSITFFQHLQDSNNFIGSYNCTNGGSTTTTNRIYGFMNFLLPDGISTKLTNKIKVHLSLSKASFNILGYEFNNTTQGHFSLGYSSYYINSEDLKKADCFDLYYSKLTNYISKRFSMSSLDVELMNPKPNINEVSSPLEALSSIAILKGDKASYYSLNDKGEQVFHNVLSLVIYDHDGYPIGLTPSECYLEAADLDPAPPYLATPPKDTIFPINSKSSNNPPIKILKDDNVKKINISLGGTTTPIDNLTNKYQYTTTLSYSGLTKAFLKVENSGDSSNYTSWLYSVRAKPILKSVSLNPTKVDYGKKVTATLEYSGDIKYVYINGVSKEASKSIEFDAFKEDNEFFVEDVDGERSNIEVASITVITKQNPSLSIDPSSTFAKPGEKVTVKLTLNRGDYSDFSYDSTTGTWKGGTGETRDIINLPNDFSETKTYSYTAYYNSRNSVSQSIRISPLIKPEISEVVIEPSEVYGTLDDIEKITKLKYNVTSSGSSPIYYTFVCSYGKDKENLTNTKILSETTESEGTLDLSSIPYGNFISIVTKIKDKNYGYEETTPKEDGTIYFNPAPPSDPQVFIGNNGFVLEENGELKINNLPGTETGKNNEVNISTTDYTFYVNVYPGEILDTQVGIKSIKIDFNNDSTNFTEIEDNKISYNIKSGSETKQYPIHITDEAGRINENGKIIIYRVAAPTLTPDAISITIDDESGVNSGIDQVNYYTQLKPATDNGSLFFVLNENSVNSSVSYSWKVKYVAENKDFFLELEKFGETSGYFASYRTSLKNFSTLIEENFGQRETTLNGSIYATVVDAFGQEALNSHSQEFKIIYAIPPKFETSKVYIGVDPFPGFALDKKLNFNEIFYASDDIVPSDELEHFKWTTKTLLNPDQKVILGVKNAKYEAGAEFKEYKISYALSSSVDNALSRRYEGKITELQVIKFNDDAINGFKNNFIIDQDLTEYDFIIFDLPGDFTKSTFYYFKIDAVSTQDAQTGAGDYPSLYSVHPVLQSRNVKSEIKFSNFISELNADEKRLSIKANFSFTDIGGNNIGGSGVSAYNNYPNFDKKYENYDFTPELKIHVEGSPVPFSSSSPIVIVNTTLKPNKKIDSYYNMENDFIIEKNDIIVTEDVNLASIEKLYLRFTVEMNVGFDPKNPTKLISNNSSPVSKIHYELMPTLAYRENHLGINTKTFGTDDLFNINANQRNNDERIYVRFRGDIGELTSEIRFNLKTGEIEQVIIDGGTW